MYPLKKFFALLCVLTVVFVACDSNTPPAPLKAPGGVTAPITNPNWLVGSWFIDPANGNDNNDGSACGSTHGLKTWQALQYTRWGCNGDPMGCPRLAQNTTITFCSSQPAYNDRVIFHPTIETISGSSSTASVGPLIQITGNLTAGSATTLTVTASKSRSGNTGLRGTGSTALAQGLLYQNTTRANSVAWFTGWTSGTIGQRNTISQPFAAASIGATGVSLTENDTWASTDSLTPQTPPTVLLVDVRPQYNALSNNGGVVISNIVIPENLANGVNPGDDTIIIGPFVSLAQVWSQRGVWIDVPFNTANGLVGLYNCALDGGFAGGTRAASRASNAGGAFQPTVIWGGYVVASGPLAGTGTIAFNGVWLDDDVAVRTQVAGSSASLVDFSGYNWVGAALLDSTAVVDYGVLDLRTRASISVNTVYGSGTLDSGRGQVIYPAGAGAAATTFASGVALNIAGSTTAALVTPGGVVTTGKTLSAANLDTDLGTTSGCYSQLGVGSFCNTGL